MAWILRKICEEAKLHSWRTAPPGHIALRRSPGLRAIAAKMLNRNGVAPRNFIDCNTEGCGDTFALGGTRRVTAGEKQLHDSCLQLCCGDEFIQGDAFFGDEIGEKLHRQHRITSVGTYVAELNQR